MDKMNDYAEALAMEVVNNLGLDGVHVDAKFHITECPTCQRQRLIISRKRDSDEEFLHACRECGSVWGDTIEPIIVVESFKEILNLGLCPFCKTANIIVATIFDGKQQPHFYRCCGCDRLWQVQPPKGHGESEKIVEIF